MLLFLSIILGIVTICLALTCYQTMNVGKNPFNSTCIVLGIIALVCNYFTGKVSLITAVIFLIVEIAMMLAICFTAHGSDNGPSPGCSTVKEYAPFALLEVLFALITMGTAARIAEFATSPFWASFIPVIPWIMLIVTLISFIIDYSRYRYKEEGDATFNALAIMATIIGLVLLIWLISTNVDFKKAEPAPIIKSAAEKPVVVPTYSFFNSELQDNDNDDDDYNFGYDRYAAAVAAFEASKPEEDKDTFIKNWLIADFKESLEKDPALAAGDLAYADSILGTRFMGVFYDTAKQDWSKAINDAKETFIKDNKAWKLATTEFFGMLGTAEPSVGTISKRVTDQMYMNPYTDLEFGPDVIVMETTDQTGHMLIFSFKIKGNTFKLGYRTECGYQPVNVADVMKIKAQPNPNPKPTAKNPNPTPDPSVSPNPTKSHSGGGSGGGGGGDSKIYDKDKSDGTQGDIVAPNDNKGPGPDTNNGKGATKSTEDKSTNSTNYSDYKEKVEELKEANDPTPDVKPAATTTVDDNSAKGTGNGGISAPTPVDKSTTTGDGHKLSDDKSIGEWDGPID